VSRRDGGSAHVATAVEAAWLALQSLVKQLSDHLARSLPGFWKIAKACMDGKYRKVSGAPVAPSLALAASSNAGSSAQRDQSNNLTATRPASQCRSMALEIVKLYTSSLSSFFTLSDASLADSHSRKDGESAQVPPFVPVGTSVLCAAHFAARLLEDVAECASELNGVDIGGDAAAQMRGLVENFRWRMGEVITSIWAKGGSSLPATVVVRAALTEQMPKCYTTSKTGNPPKRRRPRRRSCKKVVRRTSRWWKSSRTA
jgi:exocyst complex component 2